MRCLIFTEPDDVHAVLVQLALETIGHQVTLMFTADQPTQLKHSVYVDESSYKWKSEDAYETCVENDYQVVWWRRARQPYVPVELVHQDDYRFILRENRLFYDAFTHSVAPNARWINPKEAATRANYKLLQLQCARECGMSIPTTLCSNDPREIRYFLLAHEASGVVYKPLCSHFWQEGNQVKIAYTARLGFTDLPSPEVLQCVPGFFQTEIRKQYELRITCFGDYLVAAKLDSQVHHDGLVDWRAIRDGVLTVEPYELPEALGEMIRVMMRRLGLVFGAFDFIVTPDGEYIFLEVNEQGQFLWLEEYNPTLNMLDIFVNFLVNQTVTCTALGGRPEHTVAQYRQRMELVVAENRRRHVELNALPMV